MSDTEKHENNSNIDSKKDNPVGNKTSADQKDASAGKKSHGRKNTSADRKKPNRNGKHPAGKTTGRKRKKRAVRRKETAVQKYFQQVGGVIAFILLIVTSILSGRTAAAGRTGVPMAESIQTEIPDDSTVASIEAAAAVQITPTPVPTPTDRPAALPIEDFVPEQDVQGFFANGIATTDGQSVTILCGGDNLIHEPIFQKAATQTGYDFNYLYENVKSFIQSADIATINQEAPLATDISEPSGYPHFNTPKEVGQALFNAGFDIINIGNNHLYDVGSEGACATEQYFQNRGIPVVGFYRNEADYENIRVINCNGIRVAILSFVEYTNLDPDDPDLGFVVTMEDSDRVREQIQLARSRADIVVAHAHWGDEGTTELTDTQVYMANRMVEWGVDIIYGNHPHVIQQLTTITRESDNQICPVIYSMGNFVSAQTHRNQIVSAMLAVKITKDANGVPRPTAMGVMPVITHFSAEDRSDIILYPLANYTQEMALSHYVNRSDGEFSLDYIYGLLNESIPDRYLNRMSSLTSK